MPTRSTFEHLLTEIRDDLIRLASMADTAIADCIKALCDRNETLAHHVSANDVVLNELRLKIEETCYEAIALQQPNSSDLRFIVGAVSVATNLERIADHAAGIARLTLRIVNHPVLGPMVDIPQMAEIGREMVKGSVDAFLKSDEELAEKIVARDQEIDRLQDQIYKDLIGHMTSDKAIIERATFLLWVSHNLERIGDRSKNICERAIYLATGELKEFN